MGKKREKTYLFQVHQFPALISSGCLRGLLHSTTLYFGCKTVSERLRLKLFSVQLLNKFRFQLDGFLFIMSKIPLNNTLRIYLYSVSLLTLEEPRAICLTCLRTTFIIVRTNWKSLQYSALQTDSASPLAYSQFYFAKTKRCCAEK